MMIEDGSTSSAAGQWVARIGASLLAAMSLASPALAQNSNQSFRVPPERSELYVNSKRGEIKIIGTEGSVIKVKPKEVSGEARVQARQVSPGRIVVDVVGRGSVKLEILVPAETSLDIVCFKCDIDIARLSGPVRASNIEGEIELSGLRSPRVEASSSSGDVIFKGDVLPSGSYTIKSISGRVDLLLPADADFRLSARSFRGGMGLGGFQLNIIKQTDQHVEGTHGEGRAALNLWTQEGSIQLHRRP
jgi:DUF4097 and DUF4098 domain-containing protein YvlB